MTVKQLRKILKEFPDNLEVIYEKFSDYSQLQEGDVRIIEAVDQGFYVMRAHRTMSMDNKRRASMYVCFPGN